MSTSNHRSLVDRLRNYNGGAFIELRTEAADAIESLQAELAKERAAYSRSFEAVVEAERLRVELHAMSSERWRYASFENPPHEHEWTDHAHCTMCGVRYDSLAAETMS